MTNTGFDLFDQTAQKSLKWIDQVCEQLGRDDRQDGYQALRVVHHAPRDRLPVERGADLSAQLPFLLRGMSYEGWSPADLPLIIRDRQEFLDYITDQMVTSVTDLPPQEAFRAVTYLLERHITEGQLEDVKDMLPEEIRDLWAQAVPA